MDEPQQQPSLELDDEFEEFEIEGWSAARAVPSISSINQLPSDWNPKKANPSNAALWQVEWDTDDAEQDDFAQQLANELERAKQAAKQ